MNKTPLNVFGKDVKDMSTLVDLLKKNIFINLNVCLPATVISYDSTKNQVDIQPAIQEVLTNNNFLDMPQIFNVPVLELGGNGLSVKIPLKAGDTGIVIFCDRDITLFKQEKKNTQPNTLRKHDLADGIFIPMVFSSNGSNNILIQSNDGATQLEISSSGINVKGNITVDGDVIAGGVSLKNHIHSGVTRGNGSTDIPTPSV